MNDEGIVMNDGVRHCQSCGAYETNLAGEPKFSIKHTVDCGLSAALNESLETADAPHRSARLRPDYPLECQRCGAPHWIDTVIPSETWNIIVERHSPGGDKWGILCMLCIEELLEQHGLEAEAEFYYHGSGRLKSKLYKPGDAHRSELSNAINARDTYLDMWLTRGKELIEVEARLAEAVELVNRQAEDDGLWFQAHTATEAYLQQELRKLHAVVENTTPDVSRVQRADTEFVDAARHVIPVLVEALTEIRDCHESAFVLRDIARQAVKVMDGKATLLAEPEADHANLS